MELIAASTLGAAMSCAGAAQSTPKSAAGAAHAAHPLRARTAAKAASHAPARVAVKVAMPAASHAASPAAGAPGGTPSSGLRLAQPIAGSGRGLPEKAISAPRSLPARRVALGGPATYDGKKGAVLGGPAVGAATLGATRAPRR